MSEQQEKDRPTPSVAGVVYGDLIYWITIVGTVIVLIGTLISFMSSNNFIDPAYMLSAIWQGQNVEQIWQGGAGSLPEGHWYLRHLTEGDGLTMAGIALGVFSVIPAILASAWFLLRDRQQVFAALAVLAALITLLAMLP